MVCVVLALAQIWTKPNIYFGKSTGSIARDLTNFNRSMSRWRWTFGILWVSFAVASMYYTGSLVAVYTLIFLLMLL